MVYTADLTVPSLGRGTLKASTQVRRITTQVDDRSASHRDGSCFPWIGRSTAAGGALGLSVGSVGYAVTDVADTDTPLPDASEEPSDGSRGLDERPVGSGEPTMRAVTAPQLAQHRLVRAGVFAWSIVGLCVVVVLFVMVLGSFRLVVVPLAIALFPASLLSPISAWLKARRWPPMLAAATVVVGFLVAMLGVLGVLAWLIAGEFSDLVATVEEAYADIRAWVDEQFGWNFPPVEELVENVENWASGLDVGSTASSVAFTTVEVLTGILLGLVALFFYLKDGDRIVGVALQVTPERLRDDVAEVLRRVWATLGGYFRGQIIVAAVDAFFIGLGLVLLGVPLAFALAVLVFFGGLFPIVGAFTAGAVAVLVALADGGVGVALAVLVLNVTVQQLEGNLLEPLIVGRATRLHPLLVLVALTAGAVTLGILGAFLAVPVTASVVRAVSYVLEREPALDVQLGAELPRLDDHPPPPVTS
jgi:putative heme transporter